VASSFLERANTSRKRRGSCINGLCFLNLGNERGPDNGGVGETAKNGYMPGKRNAEAAAIRTILSARGAPTSAGEIAGCILLRFLYSKL